LDNVYPILYIGAIHDCVRDNGVIHEQAAYIISGINTEGKKEVLTIIVWKNKCSKYWLSVLNELNFRGVKGILILCMDSLTKIEEASFPCSIMINNQLS
jgi:putative transposase